MLWSGAPAAARNALPGRAVLGEDTLTRRLGGFQLTGSKHLLHPLDSFHDGATGCALSFRLPFMHGRDVGAHNSCHFGVNAHSAISPNDPSSANRRTGRIDCDRDVPAGFAAAHGWLRVALNSFQKTAP